MSCKAKGNQGNWFAAVTAPRHPEVHGKSLPCIWDFWTVADNRYFDPGYAPGNPKAQRVVESLLAYPFAVMRKRKKTDPDIWQASGYVGIFEVANVEFGDALKFDIVRRVCDLD